MPRLCILTAVVVTSSTLMLELLLQRLAGCDGHEPDVSLIDI